MITSPDFDQLSSHVLHAIHQYDDTIHRAFGKLRQIVEQLSSTIEKPSPPFDNEETKSTGRETMEGSGDSSPADSPGSSLGHMLDLTEPQRRSLEELSLSRFFARIAQTVRNPVNDPMPLGFPRHFITLEWPRFKRCSCDLLAQLLDQAKNDAGVDQSLSQNPVFCSLVPPNNFYWDGFNLWTTRGERLKHYLEGVLPTSPLRIALFGYDSEMETKVGAPSQPLREEEEQEENQKEARIKARWAQVKIAIFDCPGLQGPLTSRLAALRNYLDSATHDRFVFPYFEGDDLDKLRRLKSWVHQHGRAVHLYFERAVFKMQIFEVGVVIAYILHGGVQTTEFSKRKTRQLKGFRVRVLTGDERHQVISVDKQSLCLRDQQQLPPIGHQVRFLLLPSNKQDVSTNEHGLE